jgi:hypothetical protein
VVPFFQDFNGTQTTTPAHTPRASQPVRDQVEHLIRKRHHKILMASLATPTTTATPKQDTRYTVTDQELQWVHDIKAAVQDSDSQYFRKHQKAPFDQPRMTPLMWIQLAIVAKGKPKKAGKRAYGFESEVPGV